MFTGKAECERHCAYLVRQSLSETTQKINAELSDSRTMNVASAPAVKGCGTAPLFKVQLPGLRQLSETMGFSMQMQPAGLTDPNGIETCEVRTLRS